MSKHTPGPLMICEGEEGWIVDTPYGRSGADGALAYVAYRADAVLYAAAPDLLAACKGALKELTTPHHPFHIPNSIIQQLKAVIAAAEVSDA